MTNELADCSLALCFGEWLFLVGSGLIALGDELTLDFVGKIFALEEWVAVDWLAVDLERCVGVVLEGLTTVVVERWVGVVVEGWVGVLIEGLLGVGLLPVAVEELFSFAEDSTVVRNLFDIMVEVKDDWY